MLTMRKARLNNCVVMPMVGIGTYRMEGDNAIELVKDAIDAGYRHVDCAYIYGNEREVGIALQEKMQQRKIAEREHIFVTNKLWDTYHDPEHVHEACIESLRRMQLDYFDMYLMHWPTALKYTKENIGYPKDEDGKILFDDIDYVKTWHAMETLVDEGLCRSIGLSNFNVRQIARVLDEARIRPANLQVECHPYFNQTRLLEYCNKEEITVTAYSPLGAPNSEIEKPGEYPLLQNPVVQSIAGQVRRSMAQVLLRYQIQRGVVVIPMSKNKQHMISNLKMFDFELSDAQMEQLSDLDCNGRFNLHVKCRDHPHYPFNPEDEDAKVCP